MKARNPKSLAQDPRARIAAVCLGTNSISLLIAEPRADGALTRIAERTAIARLGAGVEKTGRLDPAAVDGAREIIAGYRRLCLEREARIVAAVGTEALRQAQNTAEFVNAAATALECGVAVISGEEEARLSYFSVHREFGAAGEELIAVDIGGGSTEVTIGTGEQPAQTFYLPLGALVFTERFVTRDPPALDEMAALQKAARELLAPAQALVRHRPAKLFGVGGAITTMAAVKQGLRVYDTGLIHGSILSARDISWQLAERYLTLRESERAALPGMVPQRARIIAAGAAIALAVAEALDQDEFIVSDHGLRWGVLYDYLEKVRRCGI